MKRLILLSLLFVALTDGAPIRFTYTVPVVF